MPRARLRPVRRPALLALATVLVLAGSASAAPPTAAGLCSCARRLRSPSTAAWRGRDRRSLQFLAVDVALCFIAADPVAPGLARRRRRGARRAGRLSARMRLLLGWTIGTPGGAGRGPDGRHRLADRQLGAPGPGPRRAAARPGRGAGGHRRTAADRPRAARHGRPQHRHHRPPGRRGSRVIDTQPAEAREALDAIETASRETLSGLRRMLGALRQADRAQGPEAGAARRLPAAGLADLDRLAATTTAAGVRVEVRWRGERRPLPPDIDLSAYRIVQEAVTNVVRHAGTRSCRVTVDYRDDGAGHRGRPTAGRRRRAPTGTGYGLLGMRERVALLHGEFTAGPRPEGGFRVAARLPAAGGVHGSDDRPRRPHRRPAAGPRRPARW